MSNINHMSVILDERDLCDLECLANGAFSPLTSYMTRAQYESCLTTLTLDGTTIFPIPIVLGLENPVDIGTRLTLKSKTGHIFAELAVGDCWKSDLENEWQQVFATTDDRHPYIKYMKSRYKNGPFYVSGDLVMKSNEFHDTFLEYRKTPKELSESGVWTGFQTRNPLHRSHVDLIHNSAQGNPPILLHPVEGVTQDCDVPFPVRMKCYQMSLKYLPPGTVLSILQLSMRMAGPREAVWHAVIRRNYGCSHFIVGRDHAGPSYRKKDGSPFYHPLAAQTLAKRMESQIGIKIVASDEVFNLSQKVNQVFTGLLRCELPNKSLQPISGTKFREMLEAGQDIPSWYSFPEVVQTLKDYYNKPKGLCVYFIGLSGAGKSTLAQRLRAKFQEREPHREVTVLDADEIRLNLSKGLGFSKTDRSTNVRRIGYVASEIVKHGGLVIVANIAPYEEDRQFNRALISKQGRYIEVFVNTPIEECESRDVKGLYKKARSGEIKEFTGVSDPFETPANSDIVLGVATIEQQLKAVLHLLN